MPELPEVQTIASGLENNIIGKKVSNITISDKKLRLPFPQEIKTVLTDRKILGVTRRARYILINCNNNKSILVHLGMSGKLIYKTFIPDQAGKHDHFTMRFSDNSCLIYNDPRRFGLIDLVDQDKVNNHKMIKNLGPEPLSEEFNADYLCQKLQNKSINIKTAMMDNSIVVGVGNIYINESLFISGISPLTPAKNLKSDKLEILINNIKNILNKAIKLGGSTLRDYVNLNGNVGEFQNDFKIYGRQNQECISCNSKIKRIKQNGRSSFYCEKCQSVY